MLSPKLLGHLACVVARDPTPALALSGRSTRTAPSPGAPSNTHASRRTGAVAFPNPSRRIPCDTRLRSICSKPAPTSARFNYCSAIAVSRPPRAICASPRRRSARPRVRSTCSPVPSRRPPRRPRRSTSDGAGRWIARRWRWRTCSAATATPIASRRGRRCRPPTRRVMTAIEQCRTAALGGHVEQCDHCGHRRVWYNSCRNRHCPSCQSLARAAWIEDRKAELLDTEYFHVVFTVPRPDRGHRLSEQSGGLRHPLPRRRRDAPHHRRRSQAPRRRHWLLRRPAHVGTDARPSSPSALRRPGRRPLARWDPLGRLPTGLLPAGPRPVPSLSPSLLGTSPRCARRRPPAIRRRHSTRCPIRRSLREHLQPARQTRSGSSSRNGPSPVPHRCSTTSAATRTGSPSPTIG